ncbi:MAG: HAD family hydrolase [Planctomycetota bacterium]|jgi:phosphoglycolate phosphatase
MQNDPQSGFRAIIFDLDGTLLDTLKGIADSMNAILIRMGFPTHPVDDFRYLVGDGRDNMIERALPLDRRDEQTLAECSSVIAEEYTRFWPEGSKVYGGIPELLNTLQQRKIPMTILSNKPDGFTQIMVKELLADYTFDLIQGAVEDAPRKPDPTLALKIAQDLAIEPQQILFLGDTNTDMWTANAAGMYPVGALWGFRDAEELLQCGAKKLIERPQDLITLLDGTS